MELTVVAGRAAGTDAESHTTTPARGGLAVAMMGTGSHKYYPATNRSLQDRIPSEGLLL